ncbi:hypothetical protein NMY22_g3915 [Coprinellus aureogranulatus]|nr:hypothetical protein NMY22_g3915 [Coprinellus aureogranulatus]
MTLSCPHDSLLLEPSRHASVAGYRRPSGREIADAMAATPANASSSKVAKKGSTELQHSSPAINPETFPAPLVLPNDDLAWDPECPGQDMAEWLGERKKISPKAKRKVVYVAAPPTVSDDAQWLFGAGERPKNAGCR